MPRIQSISGLRARLRQSTPQPTLYQSGKILFISAVALVTITTIGVTLGYFGYSIHELSFLVQTPSSNFVGSSLNLILSIISLVFLVVIFLVQNANQEYSSQLSSVILQDRYFLGTIAFVLTASLYTVSSSYFQLTAPFTLITYVFSISTVLLVLALIAFAGYFIDIANIIEYITRRIEAEISTERIYQPNPFAAPIQDDDYVGHLTNQTQLLVSTCITAIEENQQPVVDACLESLTQIAERYLKQTASIDVDDTFLNELNDQFQFIGSTALAEYTRQKFTEQVAEAVGDIGVAVTTNRELGTVGVLWANLLRDFTTESLQYDRTTAAQVSIRNIGEMTITAIECDNTEFAGSYQNELEPITTLCTSANDHYLALLLQTTHGQYQEIYASYLRALLAEGTVSQYDVEQLLDDFAESYVQTFQTHGRSGQKTVSAGVFGQNSFADSVAASLAEHPDPDPSTYPYLEEYLAELVRFLTTINTPAAANYQLYQGYTQFLYVFAGGVPLPADQRRALVSQLSEAWLALVNDLYRDAFEGSENVDFKLNERLSDFIALIIYLHRDDPDVLTDLLEPLAACYLDLADAYRGTDDFADRNLQSLSKQLKLAGAWLNQFHDPKAVTPTLWTVLVEDVSDLPESQSRIPRPLMTRYGYPSNAAFPSRDGWWLRPDSLWSYTGFQEEIAAALNGEDGRNYVEFHERLLNASASAEDEE